ncbi:MAG: VanZ family protein [Clostridiales bacterium]|nr:VanZ family protein [Clostridiales bacterium]
MSINTEKRDISLTYLVAAIISWILLGTWIAMLFYLSSENGVDSGARSSKALEIVELLFGKEVITEYVLRKIAHVLEYMLLTALSFNAIRYTNLISESRSYSESPVKLVKSDNEMYILISMWLSLLTASVDEYHQLFVDGRDGSIRDVLIDAIGVVIMLLIIRIAFTINLVRKGRKEYRYE